MSLTMDSLVPTKTLDIENGLTLVPRIKLLLVVHPADPSSATKPIDEWQLKRSLIEFLKNSFSVPIPVPEEDIHVKRHKDMKKRKRQEPLAQGTFKTLLRLLRRFSSSSPLQFFFEGFIVFFDFERSFFFEASSSSLGMNN